MSDQEEEDQGLQGLLEQLHEWKQLVKFDGWNRLRGYARAQREFRIRKILHGDDDENIDRLRGEAAGIDLFAEIPTTEIERLEAEIEIRRKSEELENVDEIPE